MPIFLAVEKQKIAPRPPPQPTDRDSSSGNNNLLESVLAALQQQNANLIQQNANLAQQNALALQNSEAARVSAEATQRQIMEMMTSEMHSGRPSGSSLNNQGEWSLESFLQHRPAKFDGKCSADEANHWLRDMERIYDGKRCGDENRLAFTEYLLTGEAGHWWSSTKMLLEDEHTLITWECPVRKEVEFLQLVQGGMTVSEYANRFKQLMSHCIQKFLALVERAKVLEKNLMDAERRKKQQQPSSKGLIFSRGNSGPRTTPYSRPMASTGPSALVVRPVNYARPSSQPGSVNCFICGGSHFMKDCPKQGNAKYCVRCRRN
ncbi:uncharacterized protein LOC111241819 [Vigna radiata var. radiata]|uniref:Uncharacterized protein LOC111241819 n=1 Tax=Vigna radiata var. radiata TaxID=3916 RepID=A0A3Q0F0E4_VIGRR|nr:uncharacterized protein LOC111241819 [Vigna radiata var. radiata]